MNMWGQLRGSNEVHGRRKAKRHSLGRATRGDNQEEEGVREIFIKLHCALLDMVKFCCKF